MSDLDPVLLPPDNEVIILFSDTAQLNDHLQNANVTETVINCDSLDDVASELEVTSTVYQCDSCDYCFRTPSKLQEHQRTHTGEKPFKCRFCTKSFALKKNQKEHENIHTGETPFQCKLCGMAYRQSGPLGRHMNTHGVKQYKCKQCDSHFLDKDELIIHRKSHTKTFVCDVCGTTFTRRHQANLHMKIHTGEAKLLPCLYCDKCFYRPSDLKVHTRIHTAEKPYQCGKCLETFSFRRSLNKHECVMNDETIQTTTNDGKSCEDESDMVDTAAVDCDVTDQIDVTTSNSADELIETEIVCVEVVETVGDMNTGAYCEEPGTVNIQNCESASIVEPTTVVVPEMTELEYTETQPTTSQLPHQSKSPHSGNLNNSNPKNNSNKKSSKFIKRSYCGICGKSFNRPYYLKLHVQRHASKLPWKCQHCDMNCSSQVNLSKHLKSHARNKPYQCNICGKRFAIYRYLKVHANVHSDARPYVCRFCPKTYRQIGHAIDHERTHTEEKPFACEQCSYRTYWRSSLKWHVRSAHDNCQESEESGTVEMTDSGADDGGEKRAIVQVCENAPEIVLHLEEDDEFINIL